VSARRYPHPSLYWSKRIQYLENRIPYAKANLSSAVVRALARALSQAKARLRAVSS